MSVVIGIANVSVARKYLDMDNFILKGERIPALFTIYMDEQGITAKPFTNGDEFFTKFSKDTIGRILRFNTTKPAIYGSDLRLKLVGVFDNREVPTIYIPSEDEYDIIYLFEDIRNNKEMVYIPETVIVYNSATISGLEVKYTVKCKNPEEEAIFITMLTSAGIEFREV